MILLNSRNKVEDIAFVIENPSKEYYLENSTKLWYEDFMGKREFFNKEGENGKLFGKDVIYILVLVLQMTVPVVEETCQKLK